MRLIGHEQPAYPATPTGKRSVRRNVYGNIKGYVSGKQFWEFGEDQRSADYWCAGHTLDDAYGKCWLGEGNMTYGQLIHHLQMMTTGNPALLEQKVAVYQTDNYVRQLDGVQVGVGGDFLRCAREWEDK